MFPSKNQRNQFNQRNLRFRRLQPAFTLIELLVVIAIIGLLATLSVIALNNARAKSRDAKRLADAKQFQTAMELYFNAAGRYPSEAEFDSGRIEYNTGNGTTTYMQVIPSAPTPADGTCDDTSNTYSYNAPADGSTYSISFCVAQASPDLGGGELTVWSGGISGGSEGNGGGNGGGGITACSASTAGGSTCSYAGENYPTVVINNQTWMKVNLNVGSYIEAQSTSPCTLIDVGNNIWSCQKNDGVIEKFCYNNDENSGCSSGYGGIYEWAEAMNLPSDCNYALATDNGNGSYSIDCPTSGTHTINAKHRGICPSGWHVPSFDDFDALARYADNNNSCTMNCDGPCNCTTAGAKLKAAPAGTDNYGFSGLNNGDYHPGNYAPGFSGRGSSAAFWTSTPGNDQGTAFLVMDLTYSARFGRLMSRAVRCIKD